MKLVIFTFSLKYVNLQLLCTAEFEKWPLTWSKYFGSKMWVLLSSFKTSLMSSTDTHKNNYSQPLPCCIGFCEDDMWPITTKGGTCFSRKKFVTFLLLERAFHQLKVDTSHISYLPIALQMYNCNEILFLIFLKFPLLFHTHTHTHTHEKNILKCIQPTSAPFLMNESYIFFSLSLLTTGHYLSLALLD